MTVRIGILHDMPSVATTATLEHAAHLGVLDVRSTAVGAQLPAIEFVGVAAAAHPLGDAELAAEALRKLAAEDIVAVVGPAVSDNALLCGRSRTNWVSPASLLTHPLFLATPDENDRRRK